MIRVVITFAPCTWCWWLLLAVAYIFTKPFGIKLLSALLRHLRRCHHNLPHMRDSPQSCRVVSEYVMPVSASMGLPLLHTDVHS